MKAYVLNSYLDKPQLLNIPVPKPKQDEVLVKVVYCGVNRADLKVFAKNYGDQVAFPLTMGCEIVGTLENGMRVAVHPYFACGKCAFCKKGEGILCNMPWGLMGVHRNGGYAEYVTVAKRNIIPLPSELSFKDAAALLLSAGTAYRMAVSQGQIKQNDWVVVTAAASGVGVYSCQIAKYMGAKVIALAGSDQKLQKLKDLGIKHTINYTKNNIAPSIMKIIQNNGINVLIDTVGGSLFEILLPCIRSKGRIILCGATSGTEVKINLADIYYKQKKIIGVSGFTASEIKKLFGLANRKKISPIIDSIFSLEDLSKAWEKLKSQDVFGKILIHVH